MYSGVGSQMIDARGSRKALSALKVVVGGGAAVQKPVAERWQLVTGHYLTEAYGLTETSPGACCVPLGAAWDGTVGLPLPSTGVSIRDEDFNELPVWTGAGDIEKHTWTTRAGSPSPTARRT